MKFREYITEERLDNKDKKVIMDIILSKDLKKKTFILKSFSKNYDKEEREVYVVKYPNKITFVYNSDHYEMTNVLVDICDDKGYKFKSNTERNINTTTFDIFI